MGSGKKDIANSQDIELLVNAFYDEVKKDEVIGHIFHNIIGEDWSHHLPVMYSFWGMVLLGRQGYSGNPVRKHVEVDNQVELKEEHYNRWLQLWNSTVDSMFAGERAQEAKKRAELMMHLISMKVQAARDNKSIL
ncbi:MAG: group III truncated hemoglobin [Taibaiella sp.]|nr:group III truncated hemoglobin [Taibaiella sp.]